MSFEGIQRTCRAVRRAAVLHGWVVVNEARAGTDSRYLDVARGSQWLKIRISDHSPTRDCDLSVSPTEESIEEAAVRLSAPPIFTDRKEAAEWLGAMRARHLWAEYERACGLGGDGLEELKARAGQQAPRNSFLVARGDGRLYPVDNDWLETVGAQVL
jgi:hypothetical protein